MKYDYVIRYRPDIICTSGEALVNDASALFDSHVNPQNDFIFIGGATGLENRWQDFFFMCTRPCADGAFNAVRRLGIGVQTGCALDDGPPCRLPGHPVFECLFEGAMPKKTRLLSTTTFCCDIALEMPSTHDVYLKGQIQKQVVWFGLVL